MKPEYDAISGQHTTGHEWNGIKELNTPMPAAIRIWLWASIAVCIVLWLLYPSFPSLSGYLGGTLEYSSRQAVQHAVREGQATRSDFFAPFETGDVAQLAQDASLRETYEGDISVLFRDNCAACHSRDAAGQMGFPDLTDDHWLWSGTPEDIELTLQVGINASHPDTRYAEMLAFGRDGILDEASISDVADFVLSLSRQTHDADAATRGAKIFADNCASCHADKGQGGLETGAPSLTDAAWIYGGSRDAIIESIYNGRMGVMPAWSERLTASEIRQLTLYLMWQRDDAN